MQNTKKTATPTNKQETSMTPAGMLCVDTALGQLVAYPSTDPEHPGIYIDLKRDGCSYAASLLLAEYTADDCDRSGTPMPASIVCRVWGDAAKEDYTEAVTFQNLNQYFTE